MPSKIRHIDIVKFEAHFLLITNYSSSSVNSFLPDFMVWLKACFLKLISAFMLALLFLNLK
ncbi:MAG: hypothetical protein COW03_02475 [Cytophagales bacterium CG12_big_fil_rev_8_21_14_0_65_40_12]|nr:MAG: hypothetical protein COW03_02475 [Cytophagales bacterium CG12_big_fil_rev_8_21_14_0_65_40_12]PIW03410.1 MAG: hypothetical protein COW40_14720 [Cytophagales bacterium CG17_big_fil_post_rev_8_21_14_2_50_40_13]